MRNPISGSAAWFFVVRLKFICTPIFEMKIPEKSCSKINIHFRRPIFMKRQRGQYLTPPVWELTWAIKIFKSNFRKQIKIKFLRIVSQALWRWNVAWKIINLKSKLWRVPFLSIRARRNYFLCMRRKSVDAISQIWRAI